LNYRPDQAPPGSLRDIVLEALQAESPRVRTHALAALRVAGLDAALVAAVRRNLEHPDWLVRIMAIDLLARQGASFAAQVRTIAEEDADELVRRWAQSYLAEWGQDTTDADSTTREETADPESAAP
jgi:HEAT repeat protein